MPTAWDSKNRWNGKKKPVTLVSTVVNRKTPVQPSRRFPLSSPNVTTNPVKIPIKLNTTCTKVNAVIPRIMMSPLQQKLRLDDPVDRQDTLGRLHPQWSSPVLSSSSFSNAGSVSDYHVCRPSETLRIDFMRKST